MKKITHDELREFLRKHKLWLANEPDGERADLQGANLQGADLQGADLQGAGLRRANLQGADLRRANLQGADLWGADLWGADLQGADLQGADLQGADLWGAKNLKYPIACPEEGPFVAFKKCTNDTIVKLLIPEDAKRCSATSRKCRCDKAVVLDITTLDGKDAGITEVASKYDKNFIYKIGETVSVDNFNENRWDECSAGIHFFITRQEAVDY